MPDTTLGPPLPRSAFHGLLKPGSHRRRDDAPGVTASERVGLSVVSVIARRGLAAATTEAVQAALGLSLPATPLRTQAGPLAALWAGPGQWLVLGEPEVAATLEARLAATLRDHASVAEIGDGRAVLRLTGPRVREVLAKGVGLDLDPRAFGPGRTALTMASMIDVQITQIDDTPTFEVMLFRGFAGSFWHWLEESAAPVGLDVSTSG